MKIIRILLVAVLIYVVAWIMVAPSLGTIRCGNWVLERGEYKCNELKIGLLNPLHRFDGNRPR